MGDDMSVTLLVEELRRNHFLLRIDLSNGPNEDRKVSEPLSTMLSTPLKCFSSAAHHDAVAERWHWSMYKAAHTSYTASLIERSNSFSRSLENHTQRRSIHSNNYAAITYLQYALIQNETSLIEYINHSLPNVTNNRREFNWNLQVGLPCTMTSVAFELWHLTSEDPQQDVVRSAKGSSSLYMNYLRSLSHMACGCALRYHHYSTLHTLHAAD